MLLLKSFLSGLPGGKDVSIILRNCLPMLVFTAEFQGGLNQVTLRVRGFRLGGVGGSWGGGVNVRLWLCPLFLRASWYGGAAASNTDLFEEIRFSLSLTARGMFSRTFLG